ncbi:ABC transporter ATP-binding protein [Caproicibacter sp.]|uniref:ABC transporter ATP-binding protein n=1 Tax=Caproicibacter sp. TaxID=2814884 RepID=UPI003988CEF1
MSEQKSRKESNSTPSRGPGGFGGHGGHGMMMPGEKASNFKGTISRLIKYLGAYKLPILICFVFSAASAVFSIVGPKILGQATTTLFEGAMGKIAGSGVGIDFSAIARILITLALLYVLSALAGYIQSWIMAGVSVKISYRFRKDISEKINRLPLSYFDGVSQGEVLSRVTNDVDTVNQTLNQNISQMISSVTTLVGVLVMMLTISWLMTLVTLLIIPLSLILVTAVAKFSQKYFAQQQNYLGHVNGHIEEMYGGHLVMKAFNGEEKSVEKFDKLNRVLYDSAWKSQFLSGLMMPAMNFIGNLGFVAMCILGGWLAVKKAITVGDIQAFVQYVKSFTQPLAQVAGISNTIQQTAAAAERVFEFLDEKEESPDAGHADIAQPPADQVEFKNVRFGYSPDKIIINDFSASVKPGQKVAIVGPTGAGKTTIVKLLMRFYELNGGSIRIDGHDSRDFTREELRSKFGMVLQDTWLYNGTILENIRYGRLDATDEEVMEAAKAAHCDNFIRALPDGYNMILDEEASNISQGQKQLLTIARAILADPKILILDEATSSVDTRTEVLIQKAMDRLMKGRTSFVIAHRLSTIRDADLILVMNDGDIVEQGRHEELLKQGGFYANLYNSQFEMAQAG